MTTTEPWRGVVVHFTPCDYWRTSTKRQVTIDCNPTSLRSAYRHRRRIGLSPVHARLVVAAIHAIDWAPPRPTEQGASS